MPEEAKIVKRIYREYLEGTIMLKIARGLEAGGILNGAGRERRHISNISKILRNEKYIGDALLQKTYTVDSLTKQRVKNNGLVPQYYVENSHKAIITREYFHANAGGVCAPSHRPHQPEWEEPGLQQRSLPVEHRFLRLLWRVLPQDSLVQPWQEVRCLAMHQPS